MKSSRKYPCADSRNTGTHRRGISGFTLLEILTAVAVLSLLVAMLTQMLGTISRTWTEGQLRVNNFAKARVMLDLMARDLQNGLFRSDLAAFPNSTFAFYTQGSGVSTSSTDSLRSVSLVKYEVDSTSTNSVLQRSDLAIPWSSSASLVSFGNTTSLPMLSSVVARDTSPGVLDFKTIFVYSDGTLTTSYTASSSNPVRSVGLTLAVVDDQTIKHLTSAQISALRTGLDGAISGSCSVKSDWDAYLKSTSMNWTTYPRTLAVGLKIFERYVTLPAQ
jgi:prepilin-type N-terminal cleavage/methylation domain-containing protein